MRSKPDLETSWDVRELAELNAAPWQVDLLNLNPSYTCWGPGEDCMWKDDGSWTSRKQFKTWKEFGPWTLDELNECANFYFELNRKSTECTTCAGKCHHPDSQWVTESFYSHSSPFGSSIGPVATHPIFLAYGVNPKGYPSEETLAAYSPEFREFCEAMRAGNGAWHDKITQDEADILAAEKRLFFFGGNTSAAEINAAQSGQSVMIGHDAINRNILIQARLKRFGLPPWCKYCEGNGYVHTEETAHVSLVLWILHPRKGASRGLKVERLEESEIPEVRTWLRAAANRNADRFAAV